MTREEAIIIFEAWAKCNYEPTRQAAQMAISALRSATREQVEKSWAGCEYCEKHKINLVRIEMNCNDSPGSPKRLNPTRVPKFCPMCGRPLTEEAWAELERRLRG